MSTQSIKNEILEERKKQVSRGYDGDHDSKEHPTGQLALAAVSVMYGLSGGEPNWVQSICDQHAANPRKRLIIGVAMLEAEIDRIIAGIERLDKIKAEVIKRCPFCNKPCEMRVYDSCFVECNNCLTKGPPCATREQALIAWNTRFETTALKTDSRRRKKVNCAK